MAIQLAKMRTTPCPFDRLMNGILEKVMRKKTSCPPLHFRSASVAMPFAKPLTGERISRANRLPLAVALVLIWMFGAGTAAWATTTTIGGTVYMPNGTSVLPNVLVYVTTGTATAPAAGANCPG